VGSFTPQVKWNSNSHPIPAVISLLYFCPSCSPILPFSLPHLTTIPLPSGLFPFSRPLNGRLGLRAAVWLQAKVRERRPGLRRRLYAGSVCDDSAAEAENVAIVALCEWTLPLPFLPFFGSRVLASAAGCGAVPQLKLNSVHLQVTQNNQTTFFDTVNDNSHFAYGQTVLEIQPLEDARCWCQSFTTRLTASTRQYWELKIIDLGGWGRTGQWEIINLGFGF